MRLLFVCQTFVRFDPRGETLHVRPLADRLAQRGHAVVVLAAQFDAARGGRSTDHTPEVVILPSVLRYHHATLNPGIMGFCATHLGGFDLVHIFGLYDFLSPLPAWLCRRWEIPYVLEPMGMYPPRVGGLRGKRLYNALVGRAVLRGAEAIVATSDLERAQLVAAGVGEGRIVVRRNGVEVFEVPLGAPARFRQRWGIPAAEPLIAYLGRLAPVKGLEQLLTAFAAIRPPTCHLALIGPDDAAGYARRLAQLAASLGIASRVHLTGPLYGVDKAAGLSAANLFVLPSLSENFGMAAGEAMAYGTPVLVTDRCGIAPVVADRAGVVVPCDVEGLRHGMEHLLDDPATSARLGAQGRAIAATLTWDTPVKEMEMLYAEIRERVASR